MRRRREEKGVEVRSLPPALVIAAAVAAATGAATLFDGSGAEAISIAAPTLLALVVGAVAIHMMVTRRFRARDRGVQRRIVAARNEIHHEKRERLALRELDRGLDQAPTEHAALEIVRASFQRHLVDQPMELHLIDPVDPVLTLVVATGNHATLPGERVSPWDSLAARTARTILYDTTDRVDVCPHLRSRLTDPMSAVAVPVNTTGRLLGVLYGFGAENEQPGPGDVEFLEDIATVIGARIAILRTGGLASEREVVDRLTGLPDRATMQDRLLRLLKDRTPFTVAVADIDEFGKLNQAHGRSAGDFALQLVASVARRSIRPDDILGRIGGDELLFVLPDSLPDDATRALERLREELVLAQSDADQPRFTLSIGVVGSSTGTTIEKILHRAAEALQHAKSEGGNRVVVAHPAHEAPPA